MERKRITQRPPLFFFAIKRKLLFRPIKSPITPLISLAEEKPNGSSFPLPPPPFFFSLGRSIVPSMSPSRLASTGRKKRKSLPGSMRGGSGHGVAWHGMAWSPGAFESGRERPGGKKKGQGSGNFSVNPGVEGKTRCPVFFFLSFFFRVAFQKKKY